MAKEKPKPGIYPRERPRATSSQAEIAVYDAVRKQLPHGWYCWHSLAVFTEDREEAEGDFVIAVPERGMLVLEVKGGKIELRDGRWFQNSRDMEKPPLAQARRTAELIRRRFEEAGAFYPPFGHAVVFPETPFSGAGGPDDVRDRVLNQYDLLAGADLRWRRHRQDPHRARGGDALRCRGWKAPAPLLQRRSRGVASIADRFLRDHGFNRAAVRPRSASPHRRGTFVRRGSGPGILRVRRSWDGGGHTILLSATATAASTRVIAASESRRRRRTRSPAGVRGERAKRSPCATGASGGRFALSRAIPT